MSRRLAERASGALGRRVGRRGFLAGSAVVGSALVTTPVQFALRPGTAHAAICSCSGSSCTCGSLCCDGYTEFCCTISGQNSCPPGTLTGGWWKVDGSSYCGGQARYYVDCNAQCGSCGCGANGICSGACSGTGCGCARGSCGNRKAGCTGFRYGQCHQNVACLGPIVCRVVTCVPPWQSDAACGTAVRVDNATRYHNRPCLSGEPFGAITSISGTLGEIRVTGWAIDPDTTAPIRVHIYQDGAQRASVLADLSRSDVAATYPGSGSRHGFDVRMNAAPGTYEICAYGISVEAGGNPKMACRSVTVAPSPFGNVEVVAIEDGELRVAGWAIDPNTNDPIRVHVYLDGHGIDSLLADLPRPDVEARHHRGALHGFDARYRIPVGSHEVKVFAIDVGPGGLNPRLTTRTVDFGRDPFGRIDSVTSAGAGQVRVRGWAMDPNTTAPVRVHLYVNGAGAASVLADASRPDLDGFQNGLAHGFDEVIPVGSSPVITAFAINDGAGNNVKIGTWPEGA